MRNIFFPHYLSGEPKTEKDTIENKKTAEDVGLLA